MRYGIFNLRADKFEYPDRFHSSRAAYIQLESLGTPVELAVVVCCPFHDDEPEDCCECYLLGEESIEMYRDE